MVSPDRMRAVLLTALLGAAACADGDEAASGPDGSSAAITIPDGSYRMVEGWAELPEGVPIWGQTIGVEYDPAGYVWAFHRCFANNCVGPRANTPAMLKLDLDGKVVDQWGEGLFVWPHGSFLDADGNLWTTDAQGREGIGHQVWKFSPDGEVLMTLGQPGVAGDGEDTFNGPADVVVGDNGDIFVADGHGNNRVVKLSAAGDFIMQWGQAGTGPGEFDEPHSIALDSQGRLFVGDRVNQRIQIFDQSGTYLDEWPDIMASGIHITADDLVFVADYQLQNGIVIANAADLSPIGFIPEALPEGVAVGPDGSVYVGEVIFQHMKKFERIQP